MSYLNVAPFHWGCESWGVELVSCVPRELGRMAARGQVDAGPMAVVDWFALEDDFEPVGPYGIASNGPAESVLLFSVKPIEALDDAVVRVTEETSTSLQLLRLLLEQHYGVRVRDYQRGGEKGDAWLLIGDAALEEAKRGRAKFVYDLGEEWRRWQGLPFVFARWVIRRRLAKEEKERFLRSLEESFNTAMERLEEIGTQCVGQGSLDADEIVAYLRNLVYRIGAEEERGLAEFKRLLGNDAADALRGQ
jgi:chorismate dehydratase